ncbi:hypothetical protein [Parathalassolituus penaei]|uniref:Uncharacterized protein n=1 Tax=Parathalassolituus penaei TaxID=2997323 RepID=A0A9X3EHR4_9GAMM|nr:hypothetical protein [Parathalassolituus penaei]MCY0967440.1 hypothetical protein [Parathalassolituus penaei]
MLGMFADQAVFFLWLLGVSTTLFFAIPLFAVPLRWARLMQWTIPEHTDLAVYFGRCVGAFVLVVECFIFRAASSGEWLEATFQLLLLVFAAMLVVHVMGAVLRIQPLTETLEIGLWLLLLVAATLCYPVAA